MNKIKIYIILILSLSLILSISGVAKFCLCNHNVNIMQETINDLDCCETNRITTEESISCCSSNEKSITNIKGDKKCEDFHNSCTVCNVETFLLVNNKDTILTKDISSSFQVFKNVQLILTTNNIDNSKGKTFLKFLRMNNLSNKLGKDILISIHKLKIPLPALV